MLKILEFGNENQILSLQFYTSVALEKIFHRLASGSIHFIYDSFSTTHIFPQEFWVPQGTFILQYVL